MSEVSKSLGNSIMDILGDKKHTTMCPYCGMQIKRNSRACRDCGATFQPESLKDYWQSDPLILLDITLENSGEFDDPTSIVNDPIEGEAASQIREMQNDLLGWIDEGYLTETAKFLLAAVGIDYRQYEAEEVIECEVCEDRFEESHIQEHHISYLHDFTIDVCYGCHRKIHHKDGYYDELQPDIPREKAEKLRGSGYLEDV